MNDKERVTASEAMTSTIQRPNARYVAQGPQCGQHRNRNDSMSVAKPIGIVPRNRLLVGSWIMTSQISG